MADPNSRDDLIVAAASMASYDAHTWGTFVAALDRYYADVKDDVVTAVPGYPSAQAQGRALAYRELIAYLRECRTVGAKIQQVRQHRPSK